MNDSYTNVSYSKNQSLDSKPASRPKKIHKSFPTNRPRGKGMTVDSNNLSASE